MPEVGSGIVPTPSAVGTLAEALAAEGAVGIRVISEHDPRCPGGGDFCASHCPVPVQVQIGPDDLAAVAVDWFRQSEVVRTAIRAALAKHWDYGPTANFDGWECGCGERISDDSEGVLDEQMQAHAATAALAAVSEALTEGAGK